MKSSPFRSIRQTLFNEGKLLRYLGYAIGEIALIIIGIMLALELNNWNEDRKAQAEFEVYIEQLKADVQTTINNVEQSIRISTSFKERTQFVATFLELPEYDAEDVATFEAGLNAFGSYAETIVHVGLLGELLNGNKDIIGRDPLLTQKALEMESKVEARLSIMGHLYNQMDLDSSRINQFRGRGSTSNNIPPKYDLESLRSSPEFIYTAHTISNRLNKSVTDSEYILRTLKTFLEALQEY